LTKTKCDIAALSTQQLLLCSDHKELSLLIATLYAYFSLKHNWCHHRGHHTQTLHKHFTKQKRSQAVGKYIH